MANSTSTLAIDVLFPVAGQDNDSQGFRDNFNRIKTALTDAEDRIDVLESSISTEGGMEYVTATHVVAHKDVTIGGTLITVDANNQLVISANGQAGTLVARPNVVTLIGAYALTDSVTNTSTGTSAVTTGSEAVLPGATIIFPNITGTFEVTSVDLASNYITVTPEFTDTPRPFNVGDELTFVNPFFTGTGANAGDLYVTGNIWATGNITAFYGSSSDSRLKENIVPIENALGKLKEITGVMYDWNDDYLSKIPKEVSQKFPKHDTGVIAQDVQKVLPEVVTTDDDGHLGVKYDKLAGLIIQAINELSAQVEELKNKNS